MADADIATERAEGIPYYHREEGLCIWWQDGQGWTARREEPLQKEPLWRPWLVAAARKVRLEIGPLESTTRVSLFDVKSGALRAELSGISGVCHIAPNGRWIAGLHTQKGVEM